LISYPLIVIILLLISAAFYFGKTNPFKKKMYVLFNLLASGLLIYQSLTVLITQKPAEFYLQLNHPIGLVNLQIDPLSAFFLLLIAVLTAVLSFYSQAYIGHYKESEKPVRTHYFMTNVFIISMILVVMAQNSIFFLIVWELMSLSSFLLMTFESEKKEVRKACLSYFVWMHIAVVFLIFAFTKASLASGHSVDFNDFRLMLPGSAQLDLIFILFFIGFGIKAGFVPFHSWLVKAHPSAPANISGVMSALMLKIGLYGILRMLEITAINSFSVALFVTGIALLSALWGIIYAVIQRDIKAILAYSSIENIGIITLGIGVAMLGNYYGNPLVSLLGLCGALYHILNHALCKCTLFFSAGNVYSFMHERHIDKLGGLAKSMKYTSVFALIASLSICALPPFNGFISEFIIYLSMFKGINGQSPETSLVFIISLVLLSCVGVISLFAFTRFYAFTFLGSPRAESSQHCETKVDASVSPLILLLVLIMLSIVLAGPISVLLFGISGQILHVSSAQTVIDYSPMISQIAVISLAFIGMLAFMLGLKLLINRNHKQVPFKTWDCGFQAGTSKMQYTGSSYSVDFYHLTHIFFKKKTMSDDLKALFPKDHSSNTIYSDLFDSLVKQRYSLALKKTVNYFSRIQSGNTRNYLMYGVIFLLILIIYVTFTG